ncbi:hypothetical protein CLOSTMETH_01669 [[Clostridium] methylpentosum DSM 5476]|uniref:Uncharacterized protein n=1 Tax=[Clostridium] methylpentosum DSM 5476 TaxID=537013 RepID=C0ECU8_9FIRM|nr:hypothetical protein CLOSTMETH_01669 [[Clostridium] methylpentosum DSM 5476]
MKVNNSGSFPAKLSCFSSFFAQFSAVVADQRDRNSFLRTGCQTL